MKLRIITSVAVAAGLAMSLSACAKKAEEPAAPAADAAPGGQLAGKGVCWCWCCVFRGCLGVGWGWGGGGSAEGAWATRAVEGTTEDTQLESGYDNQHMQTAGAARPSSSPWQQPAQGGAGILLFRQAASRDWSGWQRVHIDGGEEEV